MYGQFDTTIEHNFKDQTVFTANTGAKTFSVLNNKDVNFDTKIIYANVYNKSFSEYSEDRGTYYNILTFVGKTYNTQWRKYEYTFKIESGSLLNNGDIVTIQPCNTSLPLKIADDHNFKQITFKVNDSGLYKRDVTYAIRSYCLDKYVEGVATCINTRVDPIHGSIVIFQFSDAEYKKYHKKDHCKFSFAEKKFFGNGEWFGFKKNKSVKSLKRAKTPKRSKARKRVKNVKSLKKRAKTPKRSKA